MPIYEYDCTNCARRFEWYKGSVGPDNTHTCPDCGATANLAVSVPAMQPDDLWFGKYDESLGREFSSRKQRDDYCKTKGIEVSDSGARSSAQDARGRREAANAKAREEAVAKTVRDILI